MSAGIVVEVLDVEAVEVIVGAENKIEQVERTARLLNYFLQPYRCRFFVL